MAAPSAAPPMSPTAAEVSPDGPGGRGRYAPQL